MDNLGNQLLSQSLEGITNILADNMVVCSGIIGVLILSIGFKIVMESLYSADRENTWEEDEQEAEWYRQGAENNDSEFGRKVNASKYRAIIKRRSKI